LKLKNNVVTLDALDVKILKILQSDARQTYTTIGRNLGLSHSTVYDRVKRMEQSGVIKRYTTILDAEKIGARRITAIMTVFTDPKQSRKVAMELCKSSQVLEVYTSLSEELLIIAKIVAENQEELHEFIASLVAPLPGVSRIRTSVVTKKFKEMQNSIVDALGNSAFVKEIYNR